MARGYKGSRPRTTMMMIDHAKEIGRLIGANNVSTDPLECLAYGRDMSVHEGSPDIIVLPGSTQDVSKVLKYANDNVIPVTPRGAGTSVTGAVLPIRGGIVLDMSRMEKIISIHPADRTMVVEAGAVCAKVNSAACKHGLFFPPDPGSSEVCTVGGMAATNATGLKAVKYGPTRNWIKALQVVLPDGSIIRTDARPPRAISGYDLTHMFTSSEGTLGVITELTLRLMPIPTHSRSISAFFDDINSAGKAVTDMLSQDIDLSSCEVMDRESILVIDKVMGIKDDGQDAIIIMEVTGDKSHVASNVNKAIEVCKAAGAVKVTSTSHPDEVAALWRSRRGLVPSFSRLRPGSRLVPIAEDFAVPPSKIPEAIRAIQKVAKKNKMHIITFGHGDGNLHPTFIIDVRKRSEWDRLRKAAIELVDLALSMGGTITAEHGIGLAKAPFIRKEHGLALDTMAAIKSAIDPKCIMNPGKMGMTDKQSDIFDNFAFERIVEHSSNIQSFGKEIDDQILACTQCGLCRGACPDIDAKVLLALAFKLFDGSLEFNEDLAQKFQVCRKCNRCMERCPAGIDVPRVVTAVIKRFKKPA
jgi:glycolate oxidase subunit GlcD